MSSSRKLDREMASVDPEQRIAELERENRILRAQRNREIQGRLFAEELLARGIRTPKGERYAPDGRNDGTR